MDSMGTGPQSIPEDLFYERQWPLQWIDEPGAHFLGIKTFRDAFHGLGGDGSSDAGLTLADHWLACKMLASRWATLYIQT